MIPVRLFSVFVPPDHVVEHPTDLPTSSKDISLGPVPGWEAYAVSIRTGKVTGPILPVIKEDEATKAHRRQLYIDMEDRNGTVRYWFMCPDEDSYHGARERPCWYQSGATLRFVRSTSPVPVSPGTPLPALRETT